MDTRWGNIRWGVTRWWPPGPDTVAEVYDQPFWERDIGGTFQGDGSDNKVSGPIQNSSSSTPGELGGATIGAGGPPAGASVGSSTANGPGGWIPTSMPGETIGLPGEHSTVQSSVTYSRTAPYTIQVRDGDSAPKPGTLIGTLTRWWAGTLKLNVNSAGELTFCVLHDNTYADDLVAPNFLYVRDVWGFFVDQFVIVKKRKVRAGDAAYIEITGQSLLVKCAKEVIESYNTGYTGATPIAKPIHDIVHNQGVLVDLLALQTRKPILTVGTREPSIAATAITYSAKLVSLQAALMDIALMLQQEQAGYFYVDSKFRLQWRRSLFRGVQKMEVGKQIRELSAEYSFEEQVHRVYMYGQGNDIAHAVSLTDAGHATIYYDSPKISSGDIRCKVWRHRRTSSPAAVLDLAVRFIKEYEEVPVSISVGIIDLSKTDTAGYGAFEQPFPGAQYELIDDVLDIDETVWLKSLTYDMSNPMNVQAEFTRQASDMGSYVGDITQQLLQPFTVEDDGTQNPRIPRIISHSYVYPDGFALKDGDLRNNNGVFERYQASDTTWYPLGVWVPYNGS
jgi:hypothetical protein